MQKEEERSRDNNWNGKQQNGGKKEKKEKEEIRGRYSLLKCQQSPTIMLSIYRTTFALSANCKKPTKTTPRDIKTRRLQLMRYEAKAACMKKR